MCWRIGKKGGTTMVKYEDMEEGKEYRYGSASMPYKITKEKYKQAQVGLQVILDRLG